MPREVVTNKCRLIVITISFALIIASLAVLIGWLHNIPVFTSILTSGTTTQVNTAICFLISGIGLLLSINESQGVINRTILSALSIIIFLIASMTILEYTFGFNFNIDQVIIKKSYLDSGSDSHDRMRLITAVNFIFVAFAFLQILKKSFGRTTQFLAWMIFLLGLYSLYNHVNQADLHYPIAYNTTMSIESSVLFILLSSGIFLIKPDTGIVAIILRKTTSSYNLRYLLPLFLLVPILLNLFENQFEYRGYIDANFGDSFNAAGTFILLSIAIFFNARIIDREEKKLILAQTIIQQNEMIFREFAEHVDIVFFKMSPDLSKVLYASPAYEKIWGKSIASLYSNSNEMYESIVSEEQKIVHETIFEGLKNDKPSVSAEYRIRRPDGTLRDIFARFFRLKDNNKVFCIIGIAVDMTDVLIQKKHIQLQLDILHIVEREKTINDVAPKILKQICKTFDWNLGEVWLLDEPANVLRCVNSWHKENSQMVAYDKKSRTYTFKLGEGLPGKVWKEKQSIWIEDYRDREELQRSADALKAELHSALGIPILFQNQVLGVIEFFSFQIQKPDEEFLDLMRNIGRTVGEFINHMHTNEQIQAISRNDILTGILNRSTFEENLNSLINDNKPKNVAVLCLDINKFKLINETFGLDYGDSILRLIATKLIEINDQATNNLARLGADRFLLYTDKVKNKEDIFEYANKIKRNFEQIINFQNKQTHLALSIGIAIYPQDGADGKTLITNANLAMTKEKKHGGEKIEFFDKKLPNIASEKLSLYRDLHTAIINNQFYLNYQPQIDLKSGKICGAEALVRWEHPMKGLVSPAAFIGHAEQMGLIVSLNEHILRMVFQQIKSGWPKIPIAVNISAQQFKDKYHLVEYLESLVKEFDVDSKYIELEITENLLMEDIQHTLAVLGALQHLNFQFSIDDFGTGFSSFNYLQRIPAHKIKIDQSFIKGLPVNRENVEIVKSMIALFHSLGKKVVAEGAEVAEEIEFLRQEHCDIIQGYYYYKPMSADELIALVAKN